MSLNAVFLAAVVVEFQLDGEARKDTLLKYLGNFPDLTAVTSCFRVNLRQARSSNSILSYAVREEPNEFYVGMIECFLCAYFCKLYILPLVSCSHCPLIA